MMMSSGLARSVVGVTGLVGCAVGAALLFDPVGFNAWSDVVIGSDSSALSEVRGSGGAVLACAAFMIIGAVVARLTRAAALVGMLLYLGYGFARLFGMAVDGMPASALAGAAIVELVGGAACAAVLLGTRDRAERGVRPDVGVTGGRRDVEAAAVG
jgi:hypothetical protein